MCETFLKKANNLSKHHKTFIGSQQTNVKKEISEVQDRVIMETQEQEVSFAERTFSPWSLTALKKPSEAHT